MSGTVKRVVNVGDVVEGRYRILKALAEGGMGTVYLAEHTLIRRRVAIKVLHPELATDEHLVDRFMNEARAAGTLGHPNIVESTDMGFTADHVPYIVFEYLEGTLLTDEIYRVGGLPMRRAVRIAQQIASALQAAHTADIIHRDLKSDNIFLTDRDGALDHVKVLDFGVSRFLEFDDEDERRRGMVIGTPEFMAPEQITTPDRVDRRTDVYALGVILYEMLAACRPFAGDVDPQQLMARIVHDEPPPLPRSNIPHALQELLFARLLAKDPRQRFATMLDVEVALEAFTTRSDGTPLPSRQRVSTEDISRRSDLIPRPARMSDTPWPAPQPQRPAPRLEQQTAPARSVRTYATAIAAAGLVVGGIGVVIGLRARSSETGAALDHNAPLAIAPAPTPAPAAAVAAPAPVALREVSLHVEASAPNARVTFRRRVLPMPASVQIPTSTIVELVEVSAPGYRTTRYWLTIDRPTHLIAKLQRGNGLAEATEEQTLVALGEVAAPEVQETPAAAATTVKQKMETVAAAAPAPAREREPAPAPELPKRVVGKIAEVTPEPAGSANPVGPAPAPAPPEPPKSVAQAVEKPAELPAPPPPPKEFETSAITGVVASHRPAVLKCLAEGKKKNPSMKGTLTLQLVVALNGKIERSEVNSTLKDPLVAACVMKEARSWKFPVRNGGDPHAEIAYPFTIQ
jgi:eukaryotic-like serine/threonine-protein kinase